MIALGILLSLALWISLALWLGRVVYRATGRRGLKIAVTTLVLWLPCWDVIPAVIQFSRAVHNLGGSRITRTVQVDGYLSAADERDSYLVVKSLRSTPTGYIEVYRAGEYYERRGLDILEAKPGYYQYRLARPGAAECAATEAVPGMRKSLEIDKLAEYCIAVAWHEHPVSRYQLERSLEWRPLEGYLWPRPIYSQWARVVDHQTNEVLSQYYVLQYNAWFPPIGIIPWSYSPSSMDYNVVRALQMPTAPLKDSAHE